eukprot:TRINITY_DN3217_c0_g1_i1.p1 TRINITY_DN3217_c0_g1~~TRINITY_DN3217_c0_g1_i1.p1  ORF type:complete len:945 (-),score=388.52 TRINITY_DN3217_c0_g1_i1:458-3250(-)
MEGLGAEVSAKIRSAIKAKLIELEAYVDDELPDYIMVMVANNRTKEQMEEDLGLFLNNNCGAFTNWLHAVLEKLKKVTLEEVTKKDTKKKKVKKVSEKSSKKVSKDGKERTRDTKERDRRSKPERLEKKPSRSSHKSGGDKFKSEKNANMEELGERKRKKPTSLDDSGGKDGYDPASLLKSAIDKSKKKASPRKSSGKRTSKKESSKRSDSDGELDDDPKSGKSKTIINLKEEVGFYAAKRDKQEDLNFEIKRRGEREGRIKMSEQKERSRSPKKSLERSRDNRSHSRERSRGLVSLVSKVVKPPKADRPRSRSLSSVSDVGYDPELLLKRSLVSRAMVPPRPSRPAGREEKGVARAVNRAIMDADRSIMRNKKRDSRERELERQPRDLDVRSRRGDDPRDKDIRVEGRERSHKEREERGGYKSLDEWRRRDRPERPPRLSPDDIQRYEFLKRRHEEMEDRKMEKEIRDQRQRERDLRDRQREESARMSKNGSGGGRNEERSGRRLAMDEEIEKNVRASSLDRKLLKRREERRGQREEELRIIVRRDDSIERDVSPETPPRKRKLEDDDAELLEMRRKALESLMKRTDRELVRSRSNSRDRKIIIPLGEASSEDSDDSDSTESDESDISLSDAEELQGEANGVKEKSSKPEPTFIVTMDGIDDKYFKKSNPGPQEAPPPPAKKEKEEKEPQSKASSDAELELHPNEDFDDIPKKKTNKKIPDAKLVQKSVKKGKQDKKPDPSEKPTMKVAARKRSPILPPADSPQAQLVAAGMPIQTARPAVKPGSAAKLASSYAAKLAAIKAAKAEAADKISIPLSTAVRIKTIPPKPQAAGQNSTVASKPKVKRIPIQAPSPEPTSRPMLGISRIKSAPSGLSYPTPSVPQTLPKSSSTCKFWPNCVRKDACAFYHPPPVAPKSAEPSLGSKYKWSAT